MKNKQKKLHSNLKKLFWINTLTFLAFTIALMYIVGPFWGEGVEQHVVFERYAIIITLISIPLALKLFHSQTKKAESDEDDIYLKKYKTAYYLRFAIIDAAIIFNLVGFYLFQSQNLILMAVICIFALFFCYPPKDWARIKEEDVKIENDNNNIDN